MLSSSKRVIRSVTTCPIQMLKTEWRRLRPCLHIGTTCLLLQTTNPPPINIQLSFRKAWKFYCLHRIFFYHLRSYTYLFTFIAGLRGRGAEACYKISVERTLRLISWVNGFVIAFFLHDYNISSKNIVRCNTAVRVSQLSRAWEARIICYHFYRVKQHVTC